MKEETGGLAFLLFSFYVKLVVLYLFERVLSMPNKIVVHENYSSIY